MINAQLGTTSETLAASRDSPTDGLSLSNPSRTRTSQPSQPPLGPPRRCCSPPSSPRQMLGAYLGHTLLSQAAVICLWGSSGRGWSGQGGNNGLRKGGEGVVVRGAVLWDPALHLDRP